MERMRQPNEDGHLGLATPKDTIAMDTVLTERLSAHGIFMTRLPSGKRLHNYGKSPF